MLETKRVPAFRPRLARWSARWSLLWPVPAAAKLSRAGPHASGQQNDLSIREFEGVVVRAWIVHLDLPEAGDPVNERLRPEDKLEAGRNTLDLFVKRDLGPRQEAHGHVGFFDSTESARGGVPELRRYQLVFDLCGSRSNTL